MKVLLILMSLAGAAMGTNSHETDSDIPLMFCSRIDCGTASGWGEKSKKSWDLKDGQDTTEELPHDICLIGGVKGFKATVCLVSAYPSLQCTDNSNAVHVQKNGAPFGSIEVVPYCGLFRRAHF